jgi:hypothetical protein
MIIDFIGEILLTFIDDLKQKHKIFKIIFNTFSIIIIILLISIAIITLLI